jgi:CheY-like chemotaxis protein
MAEEDRAGKTLLVVEDHFIEREGLATLLRHEGYTVAVAPNTPAALELLRSGLTPDVILLDLMMPGGGGWGFVAERRHDPRLAAVPVIITTGLGEGDPDWVQALGAVAAFGKPLPVEDLLREIRRLCGG